MAPHFGEIQLMSHNNTRLPLGKATKLASVSMLAMLAANSAFAQNTATNPAEEIVVTAQRRSERLQEVPVAINVQTTQSLERSAIVGVRELVALVPGVIMQGSGLNTAPAIRGVFSVQSDPGNDGNIAMYVDDTYMASQLANNLDLPDIERIEVLKGPQGTLFGRNAAGGAVRIYTVQPDLQKTKGQISVGYGSFNEVIVRGYVSGPIVQDKLAAMFSANYSRSDGWNRDIVNGNDSGGKMDTTLRAKFLFQPSDDLKIELNGSYNRHFDNDVQAYAVFQGNTLARRFSTAANPVVIPTARGEYAQDAGLRPDLKHLRYVGSARATYTTGWGDLSAMAAYTHTHGYYYSDSDITALEYSQIPAIQKQMDIQSELLFTSKRFNGLQLTVGTFYYTNEGGYQPLGLNGPAFGGPNVHLNGWSRQRTNSYSGFGEANYELTDRITVIGGVRYSTEKRTAYSQVLLASVAPTMPARLPLLGKVKFNATTPRASIRYRLTEENDNVYFTYSKGFKSGLFNLSGVQPTPVLPETVNAFEVGLKTGTGRMISANISAFYYKYKNQQVAANTGTLNITTNAAASRMYGADADVSMRLSDDFTLNVNAAWLNARYESFPNGITFIPFSSATCPVNCGSVNAIRDLSGTQQPRSPKFTAGVNANYTHEYAFGEVSLSANFYFSTSFYFNSGELAPSPQYATLGLTAQYTPTDSPITFTVWGKNLTDATYVYSNFANANGTGISYWPGPRGGFNIKYAF